jgi:hypothetical protein
MIHLFYRHYPIFGREEWRPYWFDYEKCFINLLNSITLHNDVKINIVYDGEKDDNFIFKYDYNFIHINAKTDYNSFKETLKIIKSSNIQENDLIYFLENDYLHVNGWDQKVINFFKEEYEGVYLSLYDHNDKYMNEYDHLVSKIIVKDNHHYRTTPSTCGSFILRKKTLIDDFDLHFNGPDFFKNFTTEPVDHVKFILLSKFKKRNIFTPIPGLSTHCLKGLLSPTINWEKIIYE